MRAPGTRRSRRSHVTACRAGAVLLLLLTGCAEMSQARRNARLADALEGYQFHEPCSKLWPTALQVLADRGYQLVGSDRTLVGQPTAGFLQVITGGGSATTQVDHTLIAETMEDNSFRYRNNLRYRVEGRETGGDTCQVRYTAIQRVKDSLDVNELPDFDMELDLVRRLDPGAAARIERSLPT